MSLHQFYTAIKGEHAEKCSLICLGPNEFYLIVLPVGHSYRVGTVEPKIFEVEKYHGFRRSDKRSLRNFKFITGTCEARS